VPAGVDGMKSVFRLTTHHLPRPIGGEVVSVRMPF
jgi:hypothetical protein